MRFTFLVSPEMDNGSADRMSACGLEARVPVKPWLELSFLGSLKIRFVGLRDKTANPTYVLALLQICVNLRNLWIEFWF